MPLALVRAELVVGHRLGEVPEDTPMVPLQQDVSRLQRRLRLKPEAQVKELTLDLRREIDRERSRLLHRLNLLDVPWGAPIASRGQGTFKEAFRLEWYPELALELIHAGRWGTTVRRRRGGQGQGARGRGGERRRAGRRSPTPSCSPTSRTRSRPCCRRSPTAPRSTATPPT